MKPGVGDLKPLLSLVSSSFLFVSQAAGLMGLKIASFDLQCHIRPGGKKCWGLLREREKEGRREGVGRKAEKQRRT